MTKLCSKMSMSPFSMVPIVPFGYMYILVQVIALATLKVDEVGNAEHSDSVVSYYCCVHDMASNIHRNKYLSFFDATNNKNCS